MKASRRSAQDAFNAFHVGVDSGSAFLRQACNNLPARTNTQSMNAIALDFPIQVARFVDTHRELWNSSGSSSLSIGRRFTAVQQATAARRCADLLDDLETHLAQYPHAAGRQDQWRQSAFSKLREFAGSCLKYSHLEQELLFQPSFQQVTCDFVAQAHVFNPSLGTAELFQALRNVWIMNSVQMLLGQQVRLTPSVFAYSMLYPCTDNFLDDAAKSVCEKQALNAWIESRITHGKTDGDFPDLDRLFALIESEHPRSSSQAVCDSLLAIQHAQRRSMAQHVAQLDSRDLLSLSIAKGGTSVMAHGYLVNGHVSECQAEFLFGFGVVLQLLDDLQDLRSDLTHEHWTTFSSAASQGQMIDELVIRLLRSLDYVLAGIDCFQSRLGGTFRKMIWRNCVLLLLAAVAHLEEFCSPRLLSWLELHSPLRFESVRLLNQQLDESIQRTQDRLVDGKRLMSLWSVLGPASANLWRVRG